MLLGLMNKGAELQERQIESNNIMNPVRTGAEWPFGTLNQKCKFLAFSQTRKLRESARCWQFLFIY